MKCIYPWKKKQWFTVKRQSRGSGNSRDDVVFEGQTLFRRRCVVSKTLKEFHSQPEVQYVPSPGEVELAAVLNAGLKKRL